MICSARFLLSDQMVSPPSDVATCPVGVQSRSFAGGAVSAVSVGGALLPFSQRVKKPTICG
jgi:hypothetical protein